MLLACLELRIIQLKGVLGERVNFTVKLNVNISLVLDAIERERERERERGGIILTLKKHLQTLFIWSEAECSVHLVQNFARQFSFLRVEILLSL